MQILGNITHNQDVVRISNLQEGQGRSTSSPVTQARLPYTTVKSQGLKVKMAELLRFAFHSSLLLYLVLNSE